MRLLDDLINILDPGEEGTSAVLGGKEASGVAEQGAVEGWRLAQQEDRRAKAAARMQAAFGGGLPEGADVMSLAAQLASGVAKGAMSSAPDRVGDSVLQMNIGSAVVLCLCWCLGAGKWCAMMRFQFGIFWRIVTT